MLLTSHIIWNIVEPVAQQTEMRIMRTDYINKFEQPVPLG